MSEITIKLGDNLEILKTYPDNHFDSVVTDAPYGLGKEPDALKLLQDWIDHGYHEIKGKGFMGKNWDAFVPQPIFWKEVFRVLKPGGHLLCFFGTRTYDWGTMSIRLAGFEIRDMITWHYGSGFPKSLDVSKSIDKAAGIERKIVDRVRSDGKKTGNDTGFFMNGSANVSKSTSNKGILYDAIKYEGWGTALKPATEPICVARKPLCGTVSQNMITHSTGGINIDRCRIPIDPEDVNQRPNGSINLSDGGKGSMFKAGGRNPEINGNTLDMDKGRWPANVIFDDFGAEILDRHSGNLKSGSGVVTRRADNLIFASGNNTEFKCHGDSGGASRFFYCAKPSQEERNAGCASLTEEKKFGHSRFDKCTNCGGYLLQGEDRRSKCSCDNPNRGDLHVSGNNHPTVKPIALMRWLQRLVTPVGGLTLDPFAGSGTSGCSAVFEGFDIVLLEAESDYLPIIEARTAYWQNVANRERYITELKNSQTSLFA